MAQATTTGRRHDFPITPESPTEDLIRWSLERFGDGTIVLTTGFGMEGCALIDLYARQGAVLEVVYLDTGFFFRATHELIDELRKRYPSLRFRNRGTSLTPQAQARLFGERLWERRPDLCCELRKVQPMADALVDADLWVTGLRRGQSRHRQRVQVLEWSWKYGVLKFSPLAAWSRERVWEYVRRHDVPYNRLHDQGYPSIGCTHCTRPVAGAGPSDYSRAGRWAGSDKTECGLHT